jgi:DNA gyrase/topoisomerase IV subunit B
MVVNRNTSMFHNKIKHTFTTSSSKNPKIQFIGSFQFNRELGSKKVLGSVNGLTCNTGIHVYYFRKLIKSTLAELYPQYKDLNLSKSLSTKSIILANEVDFRGQVKEDLVEVKGFRYSQFQSELKSWVTKTLKSDPEIKNYLKRLKELKDTENRLKLKQYIEGKLGTNKSGSSKKLNASVGKNVLDANTKNRKDAELFIAEGNSAGGSISMFRDPTKHAILSLRGRPLNTSNMSIKNVVRNKEMRDLINLIGMGVNGFEDRSNIRYGKIIIASDADIDGALIASSLLVTLYLHMEFLYDMKMVYLAMSPIYIQGKNYIYPGEEHKLDKSKGFTRVKGLIASSAN